MESSHFFNKQVGRELASKLTEVFEYLVKRDTFLACCSLADIVPVPRELSSSDVGTSCLSLLLQS